MKCKACGGFLKLDSRKQSKSQWQRVVAVSHCLNCGLVHKNIHIADKAFVDKAYSITANLPFPDEPPALP